MRKLFFLIVAASLAGCSTSHINYQTIHSPNHFYKNILVLYIEGDLNFHKLDEDTYQKGLMGRYNDLANIEYRNHLEKALSRNLNGPQTKVIQSNEVYPLNEPVPYREFLETMAVQHIDAILLINLNDYFYRAYPSYHSETGHYYQDSEPSASFLFYLIDAESLKPACMGVSRIYGLYAGYDTLNNKFAKGLAVKLHKEKFVFIASKG